jgi:hypothetical protein
VFVDLLRSELTYGERLLLAWQLTWPAVVFDVFWSFVVHVLFDIRTSGVELLYLIPYLLLVAPCLVRRMVRRPYQGFRLKTLYAGGEGQMGFTESFKVMWLLSWRASVLMLGLLLVVSFFGQFIEMDLASLAPSSSESPFLSQAGVSVVENGAALLLLPLVFPGMFAKRFQGFRVIAERTVISAHKPVVSRKRK